MQNLNIFSFKPKRDRSDQVLKFVGQKGKMVSVSVRYLFYQPMDERIKTGPLRFPAKENPNMEKAVFD